jgi:hypothetical protein
MSPCGPLNPLKLRNPRVARGGGGNVKTQTALVLALVCVALGVGAGGPARAQMPYGSVVTDHAMAALEAVFARDDERVEAAERALESQDVERHEITICIDPGRRWIRGTNRISVRSSGARLEFLLAENLAVRSVLSESGADLVHRRNGQLLQVDLPEGSPDTLEQIVVHYAGTLPIEHAGSEALNFIVLSHRSRWYPASRSFDPATFRIVVRYPEGYSSVGTGALAGMAPSIRDRGTSCVAGDVWVANRPIPAAAVAVGAFDSTLDVLGDVFLGHHWIVPDGARPSGGERPQGLHASELKDLVRFLEACYGPYPYDWLNIVVLPAGPPGPASDAPGPGLVVVRERSLDELRAGALTLEMSKAWWPFVTDGGPLVSEGLAAEAELRWLTTTGDEEGTAHRELWLRQYVAALADSGGRAPLSDCLGPNASSDRRVCRGKGAALFELLAELIGHDAYCSSLHALTGDHASRSVAFRDVVGAFEEASGRDLDWFFYEWVCRGDLPTYLLEYETTPARGGGYAVRGVIRQDGEIYRTPVPLTIDLGVWSYEEWIHIEESEQVFEIETELRPVQVAIDARRLIPRIEVDELASLHHQRGIQAGVENEWGRAVDDLRSAAELDPANGAYRFRYGEALVNSGRLAEGLDVLEEAAGLESVEVSQRLWLARLYLRLNDYESALRHLTPCIRERPDDPEGHAQRIAALIGLGRVDEVAQAVETLFEIRRLDDAAAIREDIYLSAGRLHEASGDTAAAILAYQMALEVNPDIERARSRLEVLVPACEPE